MVRAGGARLGRCVLKVKVLGEGALSVSYGFVHLDSGVDGWDEDLDQRAGQRNGLAGAAQPGFVLLTTGTSHGTLPLRIEQLRKAPPLDDRWDEIVEVSCDLRTRRLEVTTFDDQLTVRKLRQSGPHRLRYAALRFDDERERPLDAVALDRYLVQLWPAPMAPDEILKQTSDGAAYWHDLAQQARPNPTLGERAAAERAAEQSERERHEADERAFEDESRLWRWGGREPSARLRELDPGATGLATHHRDVVDAIEAVSPDRQRALALHVARLACRGDDDSPLDWSPALVALEERRPLPPPFDDEDALQQQMFGAEPEVTFEVRVSRGPVARRRIHTGVSAAAAVRGAADPDPLAAALRAVEAASWSVPEENDFFTGVLALIR